MLLSKILSKHQQLIHDNLNFDLLIFAEATRLDEMRKSPISQMSHDINVQRCTASNLAAMGNQSPPWHYFLLTNMLSPAW